MKIEEVTRKREIENVLPLVNVVFLLLIFFMVAGSFTAPELYEVDLPYSDSEIRSDFDELKIIINNQGNLALNDQRVTLDSVAGEINLLMDGATEIKNIQLKADADADASLVVELIERLSATDIETVQIMTQ